MEPVYRRTRAEYSVKPRSHHTEKQGYKKTLAKQSVFCLLVTCVAFFINLSKNPAFAPAQKTIELILESNTNFTQWPSQIQKFFAEGLFHQENSSPQDDILTRLTKPVEASVTSPFGLRTDPNTGEESFHYGVDLGAPAGDKIKCVAPGTVKEASENDEYGKFLIISHSEGLTTLYAHCSEILPVVGDVVSEGQVIALVGDTGKVTGPHLHFEIRNNELWLDPCEFLDFNQEETEK